MTDITIRNCPKEHILLAALAAKRHQKSGHRFNTFEYWNDDALTNVAFDTHYTKVGNLIVEYRDA